MSRFRSFLVLGLILTIPAAAFACLWDYDTLKQERARFPSTLELITGKFLRHSPEFYQWRIQDRLKKLQADPKNLSLHDDLAVAYEKTGQHAKAIETMLAKEKLQPDVYETFSNLGTFHILAGDFGKGLPLIDRALAINANAHFGREKYQKWLVEYAKPKEFSSGLNFPLRRDYNDSTTLRLGQRSGGFHQYLVEKKLIQDSVGDRQAAVTGIQGMMRFANHDNPLLLESLGDLLTDKHGTDSDAKRLACRCYLKASYIDAPNIDSAAYRKLAENSLDGQTPDSGDHATLTIGEVEAEFKAELADAEKWYHELKTRESKWIADGINADEEFDRLYSVEPQALGEASETLYDRWKRSLVGRFAVGVLILLLAIITAFFSIRFIVRKFRKSVGSFRKPDSTRG